MELNEAHHWNMIAGFLMSLSTIGAIAYYFIWKESIRSYTILDYSYLNSSSHPYKFIVLWGDDTNRHYHTDDGVLWTYEGILNFELEDIIETNPDRVRVLKELFSENTGV